MEKKNILLCVTGGIAAYKAVALASKLTQNDFNVKVMMSRNATKFVTPLSFQSVSRNNVYVDTFDEKDPEKIAHIDLAEWPDLFLIAPLTANMIGKLANGIADDMISTTLLATTKPVFGAPAMNVHMYQHPAVQNNMKRLEQYGYRFIEPNEGYLACGYVGKGRMEEPETIVEFVKDYFQRIKDPLLSGKTVVVTAGPTRERIDPVRYLSNFSSGKMGYALAQAASDFGADVILISGPVQLAPPKSATFISVESTKEMYDATIKYYEQADIVIKAAAVSDYRAKIVHENKIKKASENLIIELERTEDILFELGKRKSRQFLIGFAAETDRIEEYAKEKLEKKNADMIVANDVTREGAGFGTDTNIVTIFKRDGSSKMLPKLSKYDTAVEILKEAIETMKDG